MFRELTVVTAAYLLGCVQTGYFLVRARTGRDLRFEGSGGTGASNAGRILGPSGFLITLLGDMVKAALAAAIPFWLGAAPWAAAAVLPALAAGHVWPLPLRFHGGRGVAVGLGALLVFDFRLLLALGAVAALAYPLFRRYQLAGLAGFAAVPFAALLMDLPFPAIAGTLGLTAVILVAHLPRLTAWLPFLPDRPRAMHPGE